MLTQSALGLFRLLREKVRFRAKRIHQIGGPMGARGVAKSVAKTPGARAARCSLRVWWGWVGRVGGGWGGGGDGGACCALRCGAAVTFWGGAKSPGACVLLLAYAWRVCCVC
jgi:hypothetical protein